MSGSQRHSQALQERQGRWAAVRFGSLATTLMLSIGVLMIVSPLVQSHLPLLAVYAPLIIGAYLMSKSIRFVVAWSIALVAAVLLGILAAIREAPTLLIVDLGLRCVLLAALMFWVAREMLGEVRVSLDTVLGGVCLYILIGFVYSLIYMMLLLADPTALLASGQPLDVSLDAAHPLQTVPTIFYFSFTALTTMGFGDITAATGLARYVTITEGMLGQLFPAIFIARLVTLMHVSRPPTRGA